jgi:hypothetical protein
MTGIALDRDRKLPPPAEVDKKHQLKTKLDDDLEYQRN